MSSSIDEKALYGGITPSSSGAETPSFQPNSPESALNSSAITVPTLLGSLHHGGDEGKLTVDDLDIPDDLDLSLPISTLLKLGTQRAHVKAEHSGGAEALVAGTLGLREYIRWLAILWRIYSAMELGLAEHSSDPILAPIYDPKLLARAPALAEDIIYLLSLLPKSDVPIETPKVDLKAKSIPLPPFPLPSFLAPIFSNVPAPLQAYLDHLQFLSSSSSACPGLMAHAYVRYLGDLSGGQFIAKRVKKSYELEGWNGTKFYWFDLQGKGSAPTDEEGEESRAEEKRRVTEVKQWFRDGMDQGVGDDRVLKAHLIKEANLSFSLNTHLFSLLQPPAHKNPKYAGLRYFEIRELEKQEKLNQQLLLEGPQASNSLWTKVERFVWFGLAAAIGVVLSQLVVPRLAQVAASYGVKV